MISISIDGVLPIIKFFRNKKIKSELPARKEKTIISKTLNLENILASVMRIKNKKPKDVRAITTWLQRPRAKIKAAR
jgi:hypothetical protein